MIKKYAAIVMAFLIAFLLSACAASNDFTDFPVDSTSAFNAEESLTDPAVRASAPINLSGEYGRLFPAEVPSAGIISGFLEFDDSLLFTRRIFGDNENSPEKYVIELLSLGSGKVMHSDQFESDSLTGKLTRIEKSNDTSGFDYRLVFETGMTYKSSDDFTKESRYELPKTANPSSLDPLSDGGSYDVSGDRLIYVQSDGIRLSDRAGLNAKCVLPNSDLVSIDLNKIIAANAPIYGKPRFVCNGTKIAAGIYEGGDWYGTVLYNLETGIVENLIQTTPPNIPTYPYVNRYIRISATSFLDAQTNKINAYPQVEGFASYLTNDFDTFVFQTYDDYPYETGHLKSYVCNLSNPEDRTKPVLMNNGEVPVIICGITEHYVIVHATQPEDHQDTCYDWWGLAKYKQM